MDKDRMFGEVNIDIRKLRDYCLNPEHPVGKHKARIFLSRLGLKRSDAEILKFEIMQKIKNAEIHEEHKDKFGKRFSAEITVDIKDKVALVKTVWITRTDVEIPQLVTCYVIP